MNNTRKILKNFLSLFTTELITRVLGTILTIYVARELGVKSFGQLAFATAFVSYFNIFSDLGLTPFGIREIAKDKTKTSTYGTNIFLLQALAALGLFLLLTVITVLLPLDNKVKIITLLFGLGLIPIAFDMSYIFQAHEKMEFITISRFISQTAYVLAGFALIYWYQDILFLPIASLIASVIGSLILYYLLRNQINFRWSQIDFTQMRFIFKSALPFLVGAVMIQIYTNADSVMLQFLKGEVAVGLYNAPYKIVLFILGLSGFLTWALYPALSNDYEKNRTAFNKLVKFSAWIFGLVAVPISVGGAILAGEIMNFLYGVNYAAAIPAFSILIALPTFMFLNCAIGNSLASSGHQDTAAKSVTIAALGNLFMNFLLIPKFGFLGAAVASVITEVIVSAYLYFAQRRILGLDILGLFFIKPLIASMPMAILLWLLPASTIILVKIAIGALIYLTAFFLVGGTKNEHFALLLKEILGDKKGTLI